MVYVKGKYMGIADDLSREQALTNSKNVEISKKIQESKWNKHVKVIDGVEYWISDKGNVREIPQISRRKNLVKEIHESLNHRGTEYCYYELKKKYFWPGIKKTIEN